MTLSASSGQTSQYLTPPTTTGNSTTSSSTSTGITGSDSTVSVMSGNAATDRPDSTTPSKYFDHVTVNADTTPESKEKKRTTREKSTTTVTDESINTTSGVQPALPSTESTEVPTIGLHDPMRYTTVSKVLNGTAFLDITEDDIMTKPMSPTDIDITSPSTKRQFKKTSDATTSTQKPQINYEHLAIRGEGKSTNWANNHIALLAVIATAAGIAVLIPLLIFVVKSICGAAKVAPNTG